MQPTAATRVSIAVLLSFVGTLQAQGPKLWPQEPTGFRGVPFGASAKDLSAKVPVEGCHDGRLCSIWCSSKFTIAGQTGRAEVIFTWWEFAGVAFHFAPEAHEALRKFAVAKYGPPRASGSTFGLGLQQTGQEVLRWDGKRVTLMLTKSETKPSEGLFLLETKALDECLRKEFEDLQKSLPRF
jgi:hypothetical protein